jgi:hypothetical protein
MRVSVLLILALLAPRFARGEDSSSFESELRQAQEKYLKESNTMPFFPFSTPALVKQLKRRLLQDVSLGNKCHVCNVDFCFGVWAALDKHDAEDLGKWIANVKENANREQIASKTWMQELENLAIAWNREFPKMEVQRNATHWKVCSPL